MLKKMIVLAMAVAALAAFAVPASASARNLEWTSNGVVVKNGVNISETFEGTFYTEVAAFGTFGCEAKLKLNVTGPLSASITEFSPKLGACSGTGGFNGCTLVAHSSNLPWTVSNGAEALTATKPGDVPIENITYGGSGCGLSGIEWNLRWVEFELIPKGKNPITSLSFDARSGEGFIYSGSVTPVGTKTLGLK